MKDFFVSYNKADKEYAKWIAGTLEENGYSVIIQAWDFKPGNNFVLKMHEAIEECNKTIIVLSKNYIASEYCNAEWSTIFNKDVTGEKGKLIPVKIDDVIPTGLLSNIIYIDLEKLNQEESVKALLNGIEHTENPRKKPDFPGKNDEKQQFIFDIDENGKCTFSQSLKLKLRNLYLLQKDDVEVDVTITDKRISIMEERLKILSENILNEPSQPKTEYEYDYTYRFIKRFKSLSQNKEYAIKYFLQDVIFQSYCFNKFDEVINFIQQILDYEPIVDVSDYITIDCYRRTSSEERYFVVPLDKEEFNKCSLDYNELIQLGALEYFYVTDIIDKNVIKKIGVYFYLYLAEHLSINKDKLFEDDIKFKCLLNYNIGLH